MDSRKVSPPSSRFLSFPPTLSLTLPSPFRYAQFGLWLSPSWSLSRWEKEREISPRTEVRSARVDSSPGFGSFSFDVFARFFLMTFYSAINLFPRSLPFERKVRLPNPRKILDQLALLLSLSFISFLPSNPDAPSMFVSSLLFHHLSSLSPSLTPLLLHLLSIPLAACDPPP